MFVSPAVVGDAVIIGSCAGSVYSLDRMTGNPIWIYDTAADGPRAEFHGEPVLLGDFIVIPSDARPQGHLYSFDTASGEPLWKVPFPSGVATTPLLLGDRLVVVSAEGEVAALEARTGKVLWRVTPAGALQPQPAIPSPAHAAGRVLIADNTNQILALDTSNGATLWRKTLPARPNTALLVSGAEVVVGTLDGYLNRIDVKSGEVRRRTALGGMPYGAPALSDGLLLLLVSGSTSRLVALDSNDEIRWQQETPGEWTTYRPLVTGSAVIAGNEKKDLCAFDRATGQRRWCRAVGQVPRGLGIATDGALYVGSMSGVVQAFRVGSSDEE